MIKKTNTSNSNTGNFNTGNGNAGYCNTGHSNTGNCNTGNWNAGDRNTGDRNTGDYNTGDCNIGDYNTGDCNTGDYNTGYWNTGYWNTGDCNTGYCNSITPDTCLIFNKEGRREDWANADKPDWMYATLTKWICKDDMTDKEKEAYPSYTTTGGYLKHYTSLKHAFIEAWEKADEEDRAKTRKLPNFDEDVFEEVFGFNPWKTPKEDKPQIEVEVITVNGKRYKLIDSTERN